MRCAQCGLDTVAGAAFCSRCGARLFAPRPAALREYALDRIFTSWWRFAGAFVVAFALIVFAIVMVIRRRRSGGKGAASDYL